MKFFFIKKITGEREIILDKDMTADNEGHNASGQVNLRTKSWLTDWLVDLKEFHTQKLRCLFTVTEISVSSFELHVLLLQDLQLVVSGHVNFKINS
jgi:hypothetical protein